MTAPATTSAAGTAGAPFGTRLHDAMAARGPLCVGVDPHAALLAQWGLTDDVDGLRAFATTAVEALAERVAVLKPQAAFFERHGSRGIAVLEDVVGQARAAGALVLLDAKRGDIGSTVQAYADAYVGPRAAMPVDAITASPYLGFGSLAPLFDTARSTGAGVFVLALTSNPEGGDLQRAVRADGRTVAASVLEDLATANDGAMPLGSLGAVVGATVEAPGVDLAGVNGPLLAPGIGAQGATADDVRRVFGDALGLVLPSASREVLRAGPDLGALRAAAGRLAEDMAAVLR